MIPTGVVISLLVAHFVGDFLLQSNWMAIGKGKSKSVLTVHALVYSACFLFFSWKFALVTFWLHWITDFLTSKLTRNLWFVDGVVLKKNHTGNWYEHVWNVEDFEVSYHMPRRHWFFVTIGFDQLIHYISLLLTWRYL